MFDRERYKEWELYNQYKIPRKLLYIANQYGDILTYNEVTDFYAISVEEILRFYNIKVLSDLPFGSIYLKIEKRWIEKMETCIKIREDNKMD